MSSAAARGAARAANILATKGLDALNERGKAVLSSTNATKLDEFTRNRLAVMEEEAKAEMEQDPEFQQAYPEISTFFSNLGRYDMETQQSILAKIQQAANSQVDGAFNSEQEFVERLRTIKREAIQTKLGTFKDQERMSLDKILGELGRDAGDAGQKYFASLASANALDTGMLGSFGDRLADELMRRQKEEKDASALAIRNAEEVANEDTTLANMTAEEKLFIGEDSIFARRETARAQRYAELLGINADQELLAQTPTALNTNMQVPRTPAKTKEPSSYLPSRVSRATPLRAVTTAKPAGGLAKGGVIEQRAAARRSKYVGNF